MKKCLNLWLLVSGALILLPSEALPATPGYADVVLDFFDSGAGPIPGPYGRIYGPGGDSGVAAPVSLDVVLGRDTADAFDYLSLPTGSFVVVGFTDEVIPDRLGPDFLVNERAGSEQADVFGSSDLQNFVFLGTATGTTAFDLAGKGLSDPVRAVKVVGLDAGGGSPGFDLLNVHVRPQSPTHAGPLTDGLIGYWQFDGNGRDASGGGRDLQLVGGVGFAAGLFGEALDLHGNPAQFAQRPADDAIYDFGSEDFTVQAWINFNDSEPNQVLVEKFDGSGGPGWTFQKSYFPSGSTWHFYAIPSWSAHSDTHIIETGIWHHVVARRSLDSFDIFYEGNPVIFGSDADPVPDTVQPLLIGKRNEGDGRDFPVDGRIDEVAIWDRALTDTEIAALYNGGSGMPVPEPSSAVLAVIACLGLLAYARRRSRAINNQA